MGTINDFVKRVLSAPLTPSASSSTGASALSQAVVASVASSVAPVAGMLQWTCNICGAAQCSRAQDMDRESGPCSACGSVMRFRSLCAVLTQRLFGEVRILAELQPNHAIRGIGTSDANCYASLLQEKFAYTNTWYHCEPLLDIVKPTQQWMGNNDFVVTSDVFEHVPPPVQVAFDNLLGLLKPGGVAVFSVPYRLTGATLEHYPNLHDFSIRQDDHGQWILNNVTQGGVAEEFRDLVFHGGPGSTLEMRVFSRGALEAHFRDAGFTDVRIHREPFFEHGIFWLHPWSLVMSAVRPG